MKITVAVTGASGSIYARQLVEMLLAENMVERVTFIHTKNGGDVMELERIEVASHGKLLEVENGNFDNHLVSGSSCDEAMVIVPCTVGMMGRVANGISDDTIARAADVMLKEHKKLILVVRETPLSLIHLRNMTTLSEAGAIIMPASPSFYSGPKDIEELCHTVTDRIMCLLGFDKGYKWG